MRIITSIFTATVLVSLLVSSAVMADNLVEIKKSPASKRAGYNQLILSAIKKMPKGGGYAVNRKAATGLRYSMVRRDGKLVVNAKHAQPSYCSGATYLVLLYALKDAERLRLMKPLSPENASRLLARGQADGSSIWGRWNANGPGTARLFHEAKLGVNFESYADAIPGDFMKIFWSNEIGKKEFGHLVVYLGTEQKKGETWVKFWSSNQPGGYGVKSVPQQKIKWAIFSRLTNLKNISRISKLPTKDVFLASMLTDSYTREKVRSMTGMEKKKPLPRPLKK